MAQRLFSLARLVIIILATASALEDSVAEKMQQHIDRLDAKIAQIEEKHKLREAELVAKIDQLETRVNTQEAKNAALVKTKLGLRVKTRNQFLQNRNSDQKKTHKNKHQAINTNKRKSASKVRPENIEPRDLDEQKPKRAMYRALNIAFSAYLDQPKDIGNTETLIFNQLLLNEGNNYNKNTGIFTVPIPGVYSFTYFIGERGTNQLWIGLYVNNVNKVDAAVQTDGHDEDAQGGNSVLLKLDAGDTVYVKNMAWGNHVEGSSGYRLTTFSGFLVYPIEDGPSVVGK